MWLTNFFRRNRAGSDPDALVRALQENNALLRAQLELAGVTPPPIQPKPPISPIRRRTEADVIVMTRENIQQEQNTAKRSERKTPPDPNYGILPPGTSPLIPPSR